LRDSLVSSELAVRSRRDGDVSSSDPTTGTLFTDGKRQKLLVMVCDKSTPLACRPWFSEWLNSAPGSVMTVFPAGASPSSLLPTDDLKKINACFWTKSVTECVPAILSRAGLTSEEHRVFISYRRVETQPLAEQLFDRLTREGFEVFLDRFSMAAGLDFQRRLNQELADKSMVVLLESACVSSSVWTQHEIDYTKRFRLGLLALRLPRAKPLPSVDVDLRYKLRRSSFESQPKPVPNPLYKKDDRESKEPKLLLEWGRLTRDAIDDVVARIKWTHDRAIFRRRHYLRDTMAAALRSAGVQPNPVNPDGLLVAHAVRNTNLYSIWLTSRPPEVGDFHLTYPKTRLEPVSKGVVIGPNALLEPGRQERLEWLRRLCGFECFDEGEMASAAEKIKMGVL